MARFGIARCFMLGIAALLTLASQRAVAGTLTPAQKCEVAKMRAIAKNTAAEIVCNEKAVEKGVAVDPMCISNAQSAFTTAVMKAEAKGGCVDAGNGPALEMKVDTFVSGVVDCIEAHCG
jgi:hypothetical protein